MKLPAMKRPPAWVIAGMLGISVASSLVYALAFRLGFDALLPGTLIFLVGLFMAFRAYGLRAK